MGFQLGGEFGRINDPRQIGGFDTTFDYWPSYAESRCFDCLIAGRPGFRLRIRKKLRNHFFKGCKIAALTSLRKDFFWRNAVNIVKRQITFGASDVAGQNHMLLPVLPRVAVAGFTGESDFFSEPAGVSNAAAA